MDSENKDYKIYAVAYQLTSVGENGVEKTEEEAPADKPFVFISNTEMALPAFEEALAGLESGEKFDFTLSPDKAFGDFFEEHVIDLDRNIFCVNGHFDHDNIYEGAIVPLQNEDGHRFMGRVVSIGEDKVKMDMNHPLAGKTLHFVGHVIEKRDATEKELDAVRNHGHGHCDCGCDCHHEEGECDCGHHHHEHGEGECGCEHHHHEHGEGECGCHKH